MNWKPCYRNFENTKIKSGITENDFGGLRIINNKIISYTNTTVDDGLALANDAHAGADYTDYCPA